ncbi:MAG: hypothetical protein GX854_13825 [Clostridiales bacterium]|jgi:hypothetical protein|nr:hypothetical protein [Clostridiales bacterium]
MADYRNSKWASEIIELQKDDGSWGYFHTLSNPSKRNPITTEQALRRLEILGYTINDKPIIKAVSYMQDCLAGKKSIPDRREKLHDWDIFTALMLSTWIRRFTKNDYNANDIAKKWAEIISHAFEKGVYDNNLYVDTYKKVHGLPPKGGRLLDLATFYQVSLVTDSLDDKTASAFMDYLLQNQSGIYYIYGKQLSILPQTFKSKEASRYIAAIELLAEYRNPGCKEKLMFVVDWLESSKEHEGYWDMGTTAKDGIRFPLSDSWRKKELRVKDCTYRISKLIKKLEISG